MKYSGKNSSSKNMNNFYTLFVFFLVTLKLLIAVIFYFFKKYGANQKHFIFHGVKIEFKKIDINSIL